jgi:hypothetical protein
VPLEIRISLQLAYSIALQCRCTEAWNGNEYWNQAGASRSRSVAADALHALMRWHY